MIMKKFDLCNEDLELLKEFKAETESRKEKSRSEAKLSKKADPTWIQLMDNISLEFTNFIGIRGYYNIADDRWVVIMTDVSRAHQLL